MPVVLRRGLFALALVVVLVLMLVPSPGSASSNDKVDHVLVFASLTLLGAWAMVPTRWLVTGLVAYAALTELLQAVTTEVRHGDPLDVAADLVGIGVGLVLASLIARFRRDRLRRARRANSVPGRPRG